MASELNLKKTVVKKSTEKHYVMLEDKNYSDDTAGVILLP